MVKDASQRRSRSNTKQEQYKVSQDRLDQKPWLGLSGSRADIDSGDEPHLSGTDSLFAGDPVAELRRS